MYIEIIKWGIQPLCVLYNMSDKRHTFGCEVALKTRRARTASLRVLRPRAEERPGGREQIKGDEEEEKERRGDGESRGRRRRIKKSAAAFAASFSYIECRHQRWRRVRTNMTLSGKKVVVTGDN